MSPRELIDEAARRELEAAVRAAELETSGELVVVVVRECDEYGSVPWRLGVGLAVLTYLCTTFFVPGLPALAHLGGQLGALALGFAGARLEGPRRWLLPAALVEQRLAERVKRAFAENGLQRTAGATGILIFVTLLERRVVVLGDVGIDRVLDPGESWQEVVDEVVGGLRRADAVAGLLAGIRRCGEILAHHLPASARNPDELPDAIVLED